jgi:hypothetical protein
MALLLTGCTSGGDDEPSAAAPATTSRATPSATPSGVDAAELSEQVLGEAVEAAARPAVATQTADSDGDQLTVDVVEVRRTRDAVVAEFRLSSATPDVSVGLNRFEEDRGGSVAFITGVLLEDPVAGLRYRPLSFDDERRGVACVCPVKPLRLGPAPQTVYAQFPPLPEDLETVTFRMFDVFEIPDVPVTG